MWHREMRYDLHPVLEMRSDSKTGDSGRNATLPDTYTQLDWCGSAKCVAHLGPGNPSLAMRCRFRRQETL